MDLQPTYQSQKLYKFLCGPAEMMCCKALPLKSGIYIAAVLDLLVGGLFLLNLLGLLTQGADSVLMYILRGSEILLGLTAVPFALIGLTGIRNVQQPKVHIYSLYKQIEIPVLACYMLIQVVLTCEDLEKECDQVIIVLIISLRVLFNLYFTHIVWSADLRLQHNETVLVLHGKEVLTLMREQAKALAPRGFVVAEPGQVLAQAPIGLPV
jgi:hypothetical protein